VWFFKNHVTNENQKAAIFEPVSATTLCTASPPGVYKQQKLVAYTDNYLKGRLAVRPLQRIA